MADTLTAEAVRPRRRGALADFLTRLVKEKPLGTVGGVITLLFLFTAVFADVIAPDGLNEVHMGDLLSPPSATYWLGTDTLGRDMLSRIIYGARISVIVGLSGAAIATALAVVIGVVSGYVGGTLDLTMQRVVDAVQSIPSIIMLMVIITIIGPGMWQVIVVLGLRWGIVQSRVTRAATIGIKENVYVDATVAIGCSTFRTLARHIVPNVMAPVTILFSGSVPAVIMVEASLSFLGFGIPPPVPSWGRMLGGPARSEMFRAPWLIIWPGLALAIVVYGVNIFGDAVRDLLDPRLRGGVGRYGVAIKKKIGESGTAQANTVTN